MSLFQPGQQVKLADYTGDDQIDYYYGQVLTVTADKWTAQQSHLNSFFQQMQQYEVTAPDHTILIVNEYELESA